MLFTFSSLCLPLLRLLATAIVLLFFTEGFDIKKVIWCKISLSLSVGAGGGRGCLCLSLLGVESILGGNGAMKKSASLVCS